MKVTISILTFNRLKLLRELLFSLREIRYSPLEVIVVDNHSEDGTAFRVKSEFPEIRCYRMPENKGVGARNKGISEATGEVVIMLDDDVVGIRDQEVNTIVRLFCEKPDVGAICFKILDYESGQQCNWCHHYRKDVYADKEFLTDELTEGAVAFRKSALLRSGLYPEYFFISHEGPDLLIRLLEAGFKTIYSPDICVRHRTASEGRRSWRRYYFDTRNQIWLAVRNYPVVWAIRYLLRGLAAMFVYSMRDGFLRYWIKGVVDGCKGIIEVSKDRRPMSPATRKILIEIASQRPGFGYTLKERLFKKEIRL